MRYTAGGRNALLSNSRSAHGERGRGAGGWWQQYGHERAQLFAAALGVCALEFVANSCRLNDVPFQRLELEVECEERTSPRRIGVMELIIRIDPEPPEDVKRRLGEVARHATLVNTLARLPAVSIHLSEE